MISNAGWYLDIDWDWWTDLIGKFGKEGQDLLSKYDSLCSDISIERSSEVLAEIMVLLEETIDE
jgi:hypothetical protein